MEELLDSLWALSGAMETIALVAMLVGIFLFGWATVRRFRTQEAEAWEAWLPKPWRTRWGAAGVALLIFGIALDVFAIWVRLGPPGRF